MHKVLNSRKRRDSDIPIVIEKKAKYHEIRKEKKEQSKSTSPAYGMPQYLPSETVTEDNDSIKGHKSYMIMELKKRNPDRRKIETSMMATFADRRRLIVCENSLVSNICTIYPGICDCQQIKYEFERISNIDIQENIQVKLDFSAQVILQHQNKTLPELELQG